jgi:hypothetical protein
MNLHLYMTGRSLRIVAGVLTLLGCLYAAMAAMCLVRHDSYHSLIAFLVCTMAMALSLSAWLKSCNQAHSVPRWLRASCFFLACSLFYVVFLE